MRPADVYDRPLAPEEFERRFRAALDDEELSRERAALLAWFQRRYPTPLERLAYARRRAAALKAQRVAEASAAAGSLGKDGSVDDDR